MTLIKLASTTIDTDSREYRMADIFWWAVLVASTVGFAFTTAGRTADTAPADYRTLAVVLTATPSVLLFIVVVGGVLAIRAAPLIHVSAVAIAAIAGAAAISFTTSMAALTDLSSKMKSVSPDLAQWLPLLLCGVTAVSVLWLVVLPSVILLRRDEEIPPTDFDDIFTRTPSRPDLPEPHGGQWSPEVEGDVSDRWEPESTESENVVDAELIHDEMR